METGLTRLILTARLELCQKGRKNYLQEYDKTDSGHKGLFNYFLRLRGWGWIVQFVRSCIRNARDVIEKLKDTSVKKVAVVGAGYIGVELAEAFKRNEPGGGFD